MNEQHIARLELHIAELVEGMFAHLFGKRVWAHDIALQIARSMESHAVTTGLTRPVAPDRYVIRVHPVVQTEVLRRYPTLTQALGTQIVELAASAGYLLEATPQVMFVADQDLGTGQLKVVASHSQKKTGTTQVMQPIKSPASAPPPRAQLVIRGVHSYPLNQAIINIGRSPDNHITIEDSYASRYHAQIRLRFGCYTIFDADSLGGTFVNEVRIKEHRLQTGDVIRVGNTSLLYIEDDPLSDAPTGSMDSL